MGKTYEEREKNRLQEKHPHACGEDEISKFDFYNPEETPPRMWGRLERTTRQIIVHGNTPTHVGKTEFDSMGYDASRKHPHACGEDHHIHGGLQGRVETPPRMWGRQIKPFSDHVLVRNTPTHVGKTKTG